MSVFGRDCVEIIFSFKFFFPSLARHSLIWKFSRPDQSVIRGVKLINSFVSTQLMYYLLHQGPPPLLPLGDTSAVPVQVGTHQLLVTHLQIVSLDVVHRIIFSRKHDVSVARSASVIR